MTFHRHKSFHDDGIIASIFLVQKFDDLVQSSIAIEGDLYGSILEGRAIASFKLRGSFIF